MTPEVLIERYDSSSSFLPSAPVPARRPNERHLRGTLTRRHLLSARMQRMYDNPDLTLPRHSSTVRIISQRLCSPHLLHLHPSP